MGVAQLSPVSPPPPAPPLTLHAVCECVWLLEHGLQRQHHVAVQVATDDGDSPRQAFLKPMWERPISISFCSIAFYSSSLIHCLLSNIRMCPICYSQFMTNQYFNIQIINISYPIFSSFFSITYPQSILYSLFAIPISLINILYPICTHAFLSLIYTLFHICNSQFSNEYFMSNTWLLPCLPGTSTAWMRSVTMTCWSTPVAARWPRDTRPASAWRTRAARRASGAATPAPLTPRYRTYAHAFNYILIRIHWYFHLSNLL